MFSVIPVIFIVSRSSSYYFSWKIYIIRQYCENYCANILCTLGVVDPRIPSQLHKPRLSLKDTIKLLGLTNYYTLKGVVHEACTSHLSI